ncbi:MAG: 50S ribosomal protein L11 methyltransferase [Fimbriimonadales bacterium]|nr:50S ribosomal protein L11 methyltransferase [Fimbriimonadales bacterium]
MNWLKITAELPQEPLDWSPWALAFEDAGCPSTQILSSPPRMVGYLEQSEGARERACLLIQRLRAMDAEASIETVAEEDWAEAWKRFFRPFRVGERLVIRPSWEPFQLSPGDVEVVIDPGQAFGTGDHPTTRLCLRLLADRDWTGLSVADVGCGSGILGISAAKLGAACVVGVDIEAGSVEIASANARRNGVRAEWLVGDAFEPLLGRSFDAAFSNIISAVLIRIAPDAARCLRPGGLWIVSGVIEANWSDVREAAERAGFDLQQRLQEGEWLAATFLRP